MELNIKKLFFLFSIFTIFCSCKGTKSLGSMVVQNGGDTKGEIKDWVVAQDSKYHYWFGNKSEKVFFYEGKKDGLWRGFDRNNQMISEGYFENGKANGLMKWYYKGDLMASGNMKDDKRHGLWEICDVHVKSNCIKAHFKEDKKDGIWRILHDNGKLWKEQNWKADNLVSEKCWDDYGFEIECD